MKIQWEEKDIKCGVRLGSFEQREQWMIGYRITEKGNEEIEYTLISLSDGMIHHLGIKEEIVAFMNEMELVPLCVMEILK